MPGDQPTTSAGDAGSPGATFRGGVERTGVEGPGEARPGPAAPTEPSPGSRPADAQSRDVPPRPVAPSYGPETAPAPTLTPESAPAPTLATPRRPASDAPSGKPAEPAAPSDARRGSRKVRARKVRRVVRHIDPWSVLKLSVLFYAALFLIVCVASTLLWGVARASGTVDNVESFITSVGGFGNCEPIDGAASPATTTTLPGAVATAPVDQLDPTGTETTLPGEEGSGVVSPGDDEDCRAGEELVGAFKFEDARIFQAFALGGIVLVLAGSAANVVLVLLFNLMSDLTGGVRVTVLEEETPPRRGGSGSPGARARG